MLTMENCSLAEFTRLGKQPRTYIVAPYIRPFVLAFRAHLRYMHFAPGSPREGEFHILHGVNFADTWWCIVSVPRRDWDKACASARQFGLKIANGIPYLLVTGSGGLMAMVNGRNLENEPGWEGGCEAFPLNGKDVFTIEFDRKDPTGALLSTTDPIVLKESESTAVLAILRKTLTEDHVLTAVAELTEWSPPPSKEEGASVLFRSVNDLPPSDPPSPTLPNLNALSTEDVESIWEKSIDWIKEQLAEDEEVMPVFMLYADPLTRPPELSQFEQSRGIYCFPFYTKTGREKNIFSAMLKTYADVLKAYACVWISESWTLASLDEANAWVEDGKFLGDHPQRVSAVLLVIEVPGQQYTMQAHIVSGEDGKLGLGPYERMISDYAQFTPDHESRFNNILKVNRR